jgi:hypothetical protein
MRSVKQFLLDVWQRTKLSLATVSAVSLLTLSPVAVHADNYGSGVYGSGVYNSSSSSSGGGSSGGSSSSGSSSSPSSGGGSAAASSNANESTVIQTESGLQVAINLSDGQAIPSTGYYITVTPLNGQGKSFDKAEIYLDGVLAYSGAPDSTGTLKWLWDTSKNPATKVKVIVYGPGSGTTTHEFNVTVTPVEAANNNSNDQKTSSNPESAPATSGWPMWLTWTIAGLVLLVLIIVIWLVVRRRRRNQQLPPPTFTGMQ